MTLARPCVLVCSGADPSGGAGIAADIQAISAMGAHPLPVTTVLTVQDNDRVFAIYPVDSNVVGHQIEGLVARIPIAAIKIGIVGTRQNAIVIADFIDRIRKNFPDTPVVLDPVRASGQGDALSKDNCLDVLTPLMKRATLITPNVPEAIYLSNGSLIPEQQATYLIAQGCQHVLIKGGHGMEEDVQNYWHTHEQSQIWSWPRLSDTFHGSGCTLAAAIAALLAQEIPMEQALIRAQTYCQQTLAQAFSIASGQSIPNRMHVL